MILTNKKSNRAGERGNVLFLILIAVALFAALSYAVTQSTRSGGGDAQKETNKLGSAQITQYPASLRTSIIRMVISNQDVDTLEFNRPSEFGDCSGADDTPATFSRCVFHPSGGGATYVDIPGDLMANSGAGDWIFNGENEIEEIGTTTAGAGVDAATVDLIAFLPGVSKSVCDSINGELGISTTIADITETTIDYSSASNMISTNGDGTTPTSLGAGGSSIGANGTALVGQPFGCFVNTTPTPDEYVYYHVLIER